MTDTQPRPNDGSPSWLPVGYPPPTRPTPAGSAQYGTAPAWTSVYPPSLGPPVPPPPQKKRRRTALRVLVVSAAVVFGIPGALLIVGIAAGAVRGTPSTNGSKPSAPPSVEAPAVPHAVAPSPPPELDPLDPYDLAPGDCYNSVPLPTNGSSVLINTVEPVPCSEPHTAQVVARFTYTDFIWSDATGSRAGDDCERSLRTKVSKKVLGDDRYTPGLIHSDRAARGLQSVFAACVIATDAPTTGSVVRG